MVSATPSSGVASTSGSLCAAKASLYTADEYSLPQSREHLTSPFQFLGYWSGEGTAGWQREPAERTACNISQSAAGLWDLCACNDSQTP